jgi:uncharacterized membrane protein YjdF
MKHALHTRLFFVQLGLLTSIAVVHASALSYDWYWYVWQLDTPMHFLGGLWVCLATYWLLRDVAGHGELGRNEYIFLLMSVLYVGAGWEVFEVFAGIIGNSPADLFDSGKDIVMDMLGATVGIYLIRRGTLA